MRIVIRYSLFLLTLAFLVAISISCRTCNCPAYSQQIQAPTHPNGESSYMLAIKNSSSDITGN